MIAIGFAIVWVGYTGGLWGYSLVRGYDMTLGQLVNPVHPGKWNPQPYTGTAVFPDGLSSSAQPKQTPAPKGKPGKQLSAPPGAK